MLTTPNVVPLHRVAVGAFRAGYSAVLACDGSPGIFFRCYDFEVVWIDAAANAAKMVKLHVPRNRDVVVDLEYDPMRDHRGAVSEAGAPITLLIDLAHPKPAAGVRLRVDALFNAGW